MIETRNTQFDRTARAVPARGPRNVGPALAPVRDTVLFPWEQTLFFLLFGLVVALRIFHILTYPIDSDEPQHLHVAWAWTKGLVQYRDVFDNHAPLFHILMAPFVALVGDRANIIVLMRMLMLPVYAVTLWAVHGLGRALFGRRAGLWAALLLGSFPNFFYRSVEFRADNFWVALWALALLALFGGELSRKRGFWAGLLFGALVSTSIKSGIMMIAMGAACALLPLAALGLKQDFDWRKLTSRAAVMAAGACALPLVLFVLFTALGAWKPFVQCAIRHNMLEEAEKAEATYLPFVGAVLFALCARLLYQKSPATSLGRRAACLLLVAALYLPIMKALLPVVKSQTMLSYYPLLALGCVAIPYALSRNRPAALKNSVLNPALAQAAFTIAAAFMLFNFILLIPGTKLLRPAPEGKKKSVLVTLGLDEKSAGFISPQGMASFLGDLMELTNPSDYVLEPKGESVFRPRPIYYVLELFTQKRLEKGLLPDNIVAQCLQKRLCVALNSIKYPEETRRFVESNYLNVGRRQVGLIRVAGKILHRLKPGTKTPIEFSIAIPARYAILSRTGKAAGQLDGKRYSGPVELGAGVHRFMPDWPAVALAAVWAQAAERGFSPFNRQPEKKPGKKK